VQCAQILVFSSFRVSPMFGPARISRARVHVPLAGVLPQVLRQGGHHDLDLLTPTSIADVPEARARAPPRARKVPEVVKDGVVNFDEFSSRHDEGNLPRARSRGLGVREKKGRVPGAARRLRLRRSENGRGGARIGSARRKRDGSRADEAQRARATGMRCVPVARALGVVGGNGIDGSVRARAHAGLGAPGPKQTREVVGVTRMHVE
jgi:hypothetical protein